MKAEVMQELEEEIRKYKLLEEDRFRNINKYDTYISISKRKILDIMRLLDLEKCNGVKRTIVPMTKFLTIEEIKSQFSDEEIANLVVCKVDLEETRNNIMLKHGFSRSVADAILRNIKENYEYKIEELEILK